MPVVWTPPQLASSSFSDLSGGWCEAFGDVSTAMNAMHLSRLLDVLWCTYQEIAAGGLGESQSLSSGPDFDIPGYLHKEIMKLTVHSAAELESVWAQVSGRSLQKYRVHACCRMICC